MYKAVVVKNDDINSSLLDQVCSIKAIAWPYSLEMQKDWIKKNLTNNDVHFLLYRNDALVAYMNLVMVKLTVNEIDYTAMGVGNVCASEKGKGYGSVLMKYANEYITNANSIGLLFCNSPLIDFYGKHNWNLIPKSKISFPLVKESNFETMILNYKDQIGSVIYTDRLF